MNNINKLLYLLFIVLCWSCTHNSKTEKYQNKRDSVVHVRKKVTEIVIPENEVLLGILPNLYIIDNYLIISDSRSDGKLIHVFNKHTFNYVISLAERGQGPGEIANIGHIASDEVHRKFYVSDHGKQAIFSYDLDSVLTNPLYMPEVKIKMDKGLFPDRYQYINDTLSYCRIIEPIGNASFQDGVGLLNMNTGEIKRIKNKHSNLEKNRITIAVSIENGIYVEASYSYDLLTICNLDGDLKYNIYGPNWNSIRDMKSHYGKVVFIKNKICASCAQGDFQTNEYIPTKFLVFDINGNYIQTIETGYWITDYCYDEGNNRIIMCLNDAEIQFAYLDLNGIIK